MTNCVLESMRRVRTSGSELKWALRFSSPKARATASWPLTRGTSPEMGVLIFHGIKSQNPQKDTLSYQIQS